VLSTHDSLTGLCNRAYFEERLEQELLRARRYGRPLALAIVDIDHFKAVNDRYGHLSGDVVLRTFSGLLRDSVRRTDVVARYGGEEFAVLLPETTGEEAQAKLDSMRRDISARAIHLPRVDEGIKLSFSAGVAHLPADGDRAEELITRADARLLAAKQTGRNRVL
jgi:diguanylate cyclase (GGDEF)-like protein